ncbi:BRO family protein [Pulveribacter sp.]|uniref:BRO family protein n=1 Tax=Pulveribacter sp. TaxID=2678893 RepID=UPI0028ABFEDE|nr:BRO family protein [Pulveribacter sp.]
MRALLTDFESRSIRRLYRDESATWWFSVTDVVQVLTYPPDDLAAREYWNQLKRRLVTESSQLVSASHRLKIPAAADEKQRFTDHATAETLLRLMQAVLSPRAEPNKPWLAKVGLPSSQA